MTPCVVVCVCVQKDETLLHGAVRWEQQAVLEELLRQGADTELLSDVSHPPLETLRTRPHCSGQGNSACNTASCSCS